jgi:hypothetical protein
MRCIHSSWKVCWDTALTWQRMRISRRREFLFSLSLCASPQNVYTHSVSNFSLSHRQPCRLNMHVEKRALFTWIFYCFLRAAKVRTARECEARKSEKRAFSCDGEIPMEILRRTRAARKWLAREFVINVSPRCYRDTSYDGIIIVKFLKKEIA